MKKKIAITLFLILIMLANLSFASYSTVTMSVVEEPICEISIGENSKFQKQLISKNLNEKEVTIELRVNNEEAGDKPTGEIMLVLDDSKSMEEKVGEKTRREIVFESAKILVEKLLEGNKDLKIGVVSFSSNVEQNKEATIEDAKLVTPLNDNVENLKNKIDLIESTGPRTDLEAGLELAEQQFTENATNKYMIVLSDGVPNVSLGENKDYYSQLTIDNTKSKLVELKEKNITLITMLTGVNPEEKAQTGVGKTFKEIIADIFGTEEEPTAGFFYNVNDKDIESTVQEEIYKLLLPIKHSYKNITIKDYFPKEIIDNFEFSYVGETNIGEVTSQIDKEEGSITWTIPELKTGETAVVQYKLKLKEDFDSKIVGKILDTNEKVDMTYTDFEEKVQEKTSDVTPKLKLAEPPVELPKAGTTTFIVLGVVALAGVVVFAIKSRKI